MRVAHIYLKNLHDGGYHYEEVRNAKTVHHMRHMIVVTTTKDEE